MHQHTSTSESTRTRLLIAAGITLVVLLAQLIGSIISGSLALAADTGHVAIDSIGLFLAAFTATLMTRPASGELTYGYARLEAIAGGIQAGMIIIICTIIGYQAVIRLITPTAVDGTQMAAWAVAGLLGNLASMLVMLGHHRDNLNIKAAFLEVSVDAISSVGVIAGGIITRISGITRVDAVISLLIAGAMLP
ncbi:MAG: cation diffusion facilitator family transporter, partial [Varibaculum sp.]